MSTLEKAISIAANKHAGHTDKGGKPLILHCMRVMTSVNTLDEQIVAVLHDVFETTDTSASYLLGEGFTDAQIAAIESVTGRQGETHIQAVGIPNAPLDRVFIRFSAFWFLIGCFPNDPDQHM